MVQVQVVMLPTKNKTNLWQDENNQLHCSIANYGNYRLNEAVNQHLYLITDEEIREGDWIIDGKINRNNHTIFQIRKEQVHAYNKIAKIMNESTLKHFIVKKIVASTDLSLGLPDIPASFLQEYVKSNGKIDKVGLETEYLNGWSKLLVEKANDPIGLHTRLKLTDKNEVIVHADTDNWNLDTISINPLEKINHLVIFEPEDQELEDAATNYDKAEHLVYNLNDAYTTGYKAAEEKLANEAVEFGEYIAANYWKVIRNIDEFLWQAHGNDGYSFTTKELFQSWKNRNK